MKHCAICGAVDRDGIVICCHHRYVIHLGTLTAGEVATAHAPGTFGKEGKKVDKPVLELSTGDAFLLVPGAFRELSISEWTLFASTQAMLAVAMRTAGEYARTFGITEPGKASLLLRAALAAQSRALAPRETPPDVG